MEFRIEKDTNFEVDLGRPLKLKTDLQQGWQQKYIELYLVGKVGEKYSAVIIRDGEQVPAPNFKITDRSGKTLREGSFSCDHIGRCWWPVELPEGFQGEFKVDVGLELGPFQADQEEVWHEIKYSDVDKPEAGEDASKNSTGKKGMEETREVTEEITDSPGTGAMARAVADAILPEIETVGERIVVELERPEVSRSEAKDIQPVQIIPVPVNEGFGGPATSEDFNLVTALLPDKTLYRCYLDTTQPYIERIDLDTNKTAKLPLVPPEEKDFTRAFRSDHISMELFSLSFHVGLDHTGWISWHEDWIDHMDRTSDRRGRLTDADRRATHWMFSFNKDDAKCLVSESVKSDPIGAERTWFGRFVFSTNDPDSAIPYRVTASLEPEQSECVARRGSRGRWYMALRSVKDGKALAILKDREVHPVDLYQLANDQIRMTYAYRDWDTGGEMPAEVFSVTYDVKQKKWMKAERLLYFTDCQTIGLEDLGKQGILCEIGLPWNLGYSGIYHLNTEDRSVKHLMIDTEAMKAVSLPDGFIAVFRDSFSSKNTKSTYFLRYNMNGKTNLFRYVNAEPTSSDEKYFSLFHDPQGYHFVPFDNNRYGFYCVMREDEILVFEIE